MTRIALTFIALFASACAAETEAPMDEAQDTLRAELEDLDISTERNQSRNSRIADAIMEEYGQLANSYGCSVESVVYGVLSTRSPAARGYVLDQDGQVEATFRSAMRLRQDGSGSIYGATKSRDAADDFFFKGIVDGSAIEASVISVGDGPDFELFADISTAGNRAIMKGVVVDCE